MRWPSRSGIGVVCSRRSSIGLFKAIDAHRPCRSPILYLFHLSAVDRQSRPRCSAWSGLRWQGMLAAPGGILRPGADDRRLSARILSVAGVGICASAPRCAARCFSWSPAPSCRNADPRLTTWYSLMSSTALFAVLPLAATHAIGRRRRPPTGWMAVVAIVSVCTAVAVLTLFIFVSTMRIGPFRSALIMNLEPLLATVLSALIARRGDHAGPGARRRHHAGGAGRIPVMALTV